MADVLELTFACLAAIKAWDVWRDFGPWAAAGWLVLCAVAPFHRAAWGALSAAAFTGWLMADVFMASTHAILIAWAALILATTTGHDRAMVIRTQVTALYLFAALNKVNGSFIAGHAIWTRTDVLPLIPTAVSAILIEAWLAWAVWKRHRWALPVAACLHVGIVAFMGTTGYQYVMLGSYNAMVVLLVAWLAVVGPHDRHVGCGEARTSPRRRQRERAGPRAEPVASR